MNDIDIASSVPASPATDRDDPQEEHLTVAQLDALADDALGEDTPARKLWHLLNTPEAGRVHYFALALRAGYPNTSNADARAHIRSCIGKMSERGIARAYAYRIYTGMTPDKVAETLAKCMEQELDIKTAARAAETASKILGLQQTGPRISVNVGVVVSIPRAVAESVDRIIECEPGEDKPA